MPYIMKAAYNINFMKTSFLIAICNVKLIIWFIFSNSNNIDSSINWWLVDKILSYLKKMRKILIFLLLINSILSISNYDFTQVHDWNYVRELNYLKSIKFLFFFKFTDEKLPHRLTKCGPFGCQNFQFWQIGEQWRSLCSKGHNY